MVKVEEKKNSKSKKGQRSTTQKGWLWYNVELAQGEESNEKTQPILWIEWPIGALVGASSF